MAPKWPELDQNLNIFLPPPPQTRPPAVLDVHTQGPAYKKWPRAPKFENRHWAKTLFGGTGSFLVAARKMADVSCVRSANFQKQTD